MKDDMMERKVQEDDPVLVWRTGSVGRLRLNRPQALNALNTSMCQRLYKALRAWRDDDSVRAVILDGGEGNAFCAGGDILSLYESGLKDGQEAYELWCQEYRLNDLIDTYPKPYIALIDGIVMGGGVGISIYGSCRLAGDKTLFAMPETGIGYFPDIGASYFLPKLGKGVGLWLGLTGARLKTADALAVGVADFYIPSQDHMTLITALEDAPLAHPEDEIRALIGMYTRDTEPAPLKQVADILKACFTPKPEDKNVVNIFDNLKKEGGEWAQKQLDILSKKSPTSLHLAYEAQRRGANMNLREVLRQDLRVSMHCLKYQDFFEGVKAIVVDKNHKPDWKIGAVEDVSKKDIERFFEPLPSWQDLTFEDGI